MKTIYEQYDDLDPIKAAKVYQYTVQRPSEEVSPFETAVSYWLSLTDDEVVQLMFSLKSKYTKKDWEDMV